MTDILWRFKVSRVELYRFYINPSRHVTFTFTFRFTVEYNAVKLSIVDFEVLFSFL